MAFSLSNLEAQLARASWRRSRFVWELIDQGHALGRVSLTAPHTWAAAGRTGACEALEAAQKQCQQAIRDLILDARTDRDEWSRKGYRWNEKLNKWEGNNREW
jgi:hypothetical protein